MRIKFVELQNFRKLKSCRIDLSSQETLLVGANNSGKTSAIDALIHFLVTERRRDLSITDFTLSNWNEINKIADSWLGEGDDKGENISEWQLHCPSLDTWLEVRDDEVHHVSHLIPTLSWKGGALGVRLVFQPKNVSKLRGEFVSAFNAAKDTLAQVNKKNSGTELTLWPRTMRDFLDRKLHSHFSIDAYILDPSKEKEPIDGVANPQKLAMDLQPLEVKPFDGLFRVDLIEAQRGFTDPKTSSGTIASNKSRTLSDQMHDYYSTHLDPSELPDIDDLPALEAIEEARTTFDNKLKDSFRHTITEIEKLGYPGFSDPTIILTSKLSPIDSLDHEAAVQFDIQKNSSANEQPILRLPEKYNGLGYKNLISIVFKLISFRDAWMQVGKAGKRKLDKENIIEPLHIVLVEEPEVHLHAQVQQVFIRKAYDVLRNHNNLRSNKQFSTQLVVSTHSSYLAQEVNFENLRYFRRKPVEEIDAVPCATVVNLSNTFGNKDEETQRFAARYLKTTHCDLFFANGIIMVEGAAERMLVPHFIRAHYEKLSSSYISILEIGGAHAHRLKPLIDTLGITTLIITDIDAVKEKGKSKIEPKKGMGYLSSNNTLKKWIPCKESLDELLDTSDADKNAGNVRVAYQCGINIDFLKSKVEAFPYTFEDALALSNVKLFKGLTKSTGLVKKMHNALNKDKYEDAKNEMQKCLKDGDKAKMALDMLFDVEPEELCVPSYIAEGLQWLEVELDKANLDYIDEGSLVEADAGE